MTTGTSSRNPAALRLSSQMADGYDYDEELTAKGIECAMADDSLYKTSSHDSSNFDDEEGRMTSTSSISSSVIKRRRQNLRRTWCLWILLAIAIGVTGGLCVLLVDHLKEPNQANTVAAASSASQYGGTHPEVTARDPGGNPIIPLDSVAASGSGSTDPETPSAIILPDPSVNYLYASADTAKAVNSIGAGDFTMSVHIRATEEAPQSQHPIILSNRNTHQSDDSFLFGIHERWRESLHKIPFVNVGNVNWIQYNHPNQPNVLDGIWHHFVARRKGTTLSYYVDGELIVDMTHEIFSTTISSAPESQELIIGYDQFNPSATKFVGELQELTVWNTALPLQKIESGLRNLEGDEEGLIAYFPVIPLDQFGEITSHAKTPAVTASPSPLPDGTPAESKSSSTTTSAPSIPWP